MGFKACCNVGKKLFDWRLLQNTNLKRVAIEKY